MMLGDIKNYAGKILRGLVKFLTGIVICIALYFLCAVIFTLIPVNRDFKQTPGGIKIFVSTNGVHTDVLLPVKNEVADWMNFIPVKDYDTSLLPFQYISFGWGDKGFYIHTPEWSDLKFSTAFNAMFLCGASAMHVAYKTREPVTGKKTRAIYINPEQYKKLANHIQSSFQQNSYGEFIRIPCRTYDGINDNFYEAHSSYNLFQTCNVWTNRALKAAGIKTAVWAPFDWCVMYHLE